MAKIIKECKYRLKNGRCKHYLSYCSFLPTGSLSDCPAGGVTATTKGKKKK